MERFKRNPIVEKLGFNIIVLSCVLILMYVLFSLLSDNFAGLPRILSALNYAYFLVSGYCLTSSIWTMHPSFLTCMTNQQRIVK